MRMSTEERRVQITRAAIKIIGEEGLREFTVAKVAQEVGIKDGSIFRHFKNKGEIVSSVLDNLEEVLSQSIPPKIDDPLERLGQFFKNRVKILTSQPGIRSLVFSDQLIHAGGDADLKRVIALRKKARDYIQSCLHEASQKGLIRKDLNVANILIVFHGMVMGFLFLSGESAIQGTIENRTKKLWKTFTSMIQR
jgi:AcrR family transcriptional regulator